MGADYTYNRKSPHELFHTIGIPHQILAGLEIMIKFVQAWRFEQCEEHFFFKYCLKKWQWLFRTCNFIISCYLQYMLCNFNISIFAKGASFCVPSWLEKENKLSLLRKSKHIFANFLCVKTLCCCYSFIFMAFKDDLTNYWQMCRGVSLQHTIYMAKAWELLHRYFYLFIYFI